ncbi:DEAD-box ATP-dependent RNA helicase 21 [Forsythia ovata]|uniref:DEAD-box ATP-dependent RNA helicase 21 n=1 Tax=Forsythia ovata TaxID=205694 RepID=A0ABD1UFN0_9LAMI
MMDMGFEPQVVGVLDAMTSSNLKPENEDEELDENKIYGMTYMFSATMLLAVQRLARKYLRNPVVVTFGTAGKTTDLITQHVIMMKENDKPSMLKKLLDELGDKTAIVFVNTKKVADNVAKNLDKEGYHVTTLHVGGKSQEQREISLEGFRTKRYNVLVATDVAGRGIDIPYVANVINYDMPGNIEAYTHRIERTGCVGKTDVATTFLTLHDTDNNSPVPPELARHEASKFKPGSIPDRPPRMNDMSKIKTEVPEKHTGSRAVVTMIADVKNVKGKKSRQEGEAGVSHLLSASTFMAYTTEMVEGKEIPVTKHFRPQKQRLKNRQVDDDM